MSHNFDLPFKIIPCTLVGGCSAYNISCVSTDDNVVMLYVYKSYTHNIIDKHCFMRRLTIRFWLILMKQCLHYTGIWLASRFSRFIVI